MFLLPRMFNHAGATAHVFLISGGKPVDKGLGYAGLIGPWTSVAVVPTAPTTVDYQIIERSRDNQLMMVTGNVSIVLDPAVAVGRLDFTVEVASGAYKNPWDPALKAAVVEVLQGAIRDVANSLDIKEAPKSQKAFEEKVVAAIGGAQDKIKAKGFHFETVYVSKVAPTDREVDAAIGAEERAELIRKSLEAAHGLRMQALGDELAIGEQEAANALTLERKRAELLTKRNENDLLAAEGEKAANAKRLEAYTGVNPAVLLGAAVLRLVESGQGIEHFSIVPEMFAAAKAAGDTAGR